MPHPRQQSLFELITTDNRPIDAWLASMERLIPVLYPHDQALSRELELAVRRLRGNASDLDCARTDDPSAPQDGAPAAEFLAWFFANQPESGSAFRRLLTRADQLLGRPLLLKTLNSSTP